MGVGGKMKLVKLEEEMYGNGGIGMENYYHVIEEVEKGMYDGSHPLVAVTRVVKKLDPKDCCIEKKVEVLMCKLETAGLLQEEPISLAELVVDSVCRSPEELSLIHTYWKSFVQNPYVQGLVEAIESFHFWTDMVVLEKCEYAASLVRTMKSVENVVDVALKNSDLDGDQVMSWKKLALQLVRARCDAWEQEKIGKKCHVSVDVYFGEKDAEPKLIDPEDKKVQWIVLTLCGMNHYGKRGMDLFERAFAALAEYAEMGYADMQMLLASFLENTDNTTFRVNEDMRLAHDWYAKAARQNYRPAQLRIAKSYSEGLFTEVDEEMANALYEHLGFRDYSWMMMDELSEEDWEVEAEKGNPEAQMCLANAYARGRNGYEQNDELAFHWFKKAAENGVWNAYDSLAYHYSYGVGTEKNPTLAYGWYRRAAAFSGERIYHNHREEVILGNSSAGVLYKSIADCLSRGEGVEKDTEAAKEWNWRALGAGYDEAWKDLKEDYE